MKKLKCWLFGHKYKVVIKYDDNVQKLTCTRCYRMFGINHQVRAILDWDIELENTMKLIYPTPPPPEPK